MKTALLLMGLVLGQSAHASLATDLKNLKTTTLKQAMSFPSLKLEKSTTTEIQPVRFVAGKYALIKSVLSQLPDGTWENTETVECTGTTSIPVFDIDQGGGSFSANLIECATATNGNPVTAGILSTVFLITKDHLFPSEAPFKVRDNFVMLTLKSAQLTPSSGIPYGINFSSSRDELASAINVIAPSPSDSCGSAPMPACGNPTIESFRLNLEFGP